MSPERRPRMGMRCHRNGVNQSIVCRNFADFHHGMDLQHLLATSDGLARMPEVGSHGATDTLLIPTFSLPFRDHHRRSFRTHRNKSSLANSASCWLPLERLEA